MALQRFPGFIDIHVHLRDPGATQKEDFNTGSRAAVKGGFTFICDMPNNPQPTFSLEALTDKIDRSKKVGFCDIGFHYGTNGKNLETFIAARANHNVFGLKLYCNQTTGNYLVEDPKVLESIFSAWRSEKPVLVHAEGPTLQLVIELAAHYGQRLHVCHVSQKEEVEWIRIAKKKHIAISAGVTPHHLFMTEEDVDKLGSFAMMKPPLGSLGNQNSLWEGLKNGTIDLVESDHAPHTKEEKARSAPSFGVPGLETTLGLFCRSVYQKKLTIEDVVRLLYEMPKKIFNIPDQPDTFVELDPSKPFTIGSDGYETKCGWSPFDGWELFGKVQTVVLRKKPLVMGGKVL